MEKYLSPLYLPDPLKVFLLPANKGLIKVLSPFFYPFYFYSTCILSFLNDMTYKRPQGGSMQTATSPSVCDKGDATMWKHFKSHIETLIFSVIVPGLSLL